MTTIAWDGKTMAGDRLSHMEYTMPITVRKVHRMRAPNGRIALIGFAGAMSITGAYLAWMRGGEKPSMPGQRWAILLADDEGVVWYRCDGADVWDRIGPGKHSIGSGRDFAMGAMAYGATAREAVLIASNLDLQTGRGVDVVGF